jgi:hypothetical protein
MTVENMSLEKMEWCHNTDTSGTLFDGVLSFEPGGRWAKAARASSATSTPPRSSFTIKNYVASVSIFLINF